MHALDTYLLISYEAESQNMSYGKATDFLKDIT